MNSNGSRVWVGAAATIIAVLIAAVVSLIATRPSATTAQIKAGDLPPSHWESKLDNLKSEIDANEAILRTIESHALLQTNLMQTQNELLREIRNELRRRP